MARGRLTDLDIKLIAVKDHFTRNGDPAFAGPHPERAGLQKELRGKLFEAFARFAVKEMLLRFVVGARLVPVDLCHGVSPDEKKPAGSARAGWGTAGQGRSGGS